MPTLGHSKPTKCGRSTNAKPIIGITKPKLKIILKPFVKYPEGKITLIFILGGDDTFSGIWNHSASFGHRKSTDYLSNLCCNHRYNFPTFLCSLKEILKSSEGTSLLPNCLLHANYIEHFPQLLFLSCMTPCTFFQLQDPAWWVQYALHHQTKHYLKDSDPSRGRQWSTDGSLEGNETS